MGICLDLTIYHKWMSLVLLETFKFDIQSDKLNSK